ncbi:HAD-like domain-containing protein [Irpex rosettiformis]|uniref:HAD-like domain-containing protein n=1 Tax=Irpex rosettiformis TaxID=378272 RepID=A0ACB8U705_9APHY|nr:HAD-like domain-containing protein [Irpex rosettiformis]
MLYCLTWASSTLVDTTPGVLKAWQVYANEYGFNGADAALRSHGRRLYDTLQDYCRPRSQAELQVAVQRFESIVIAGGPIVLPGASTLLQRIGAGSPHTASGWSIVTSSTNVYASKVLGVCGLPPPPLGLVSSSDVANGKPHPAPYLAGARRLGVDPKNCIVVEDAPSGILSARAAGCIVIAVCTSHTRQQLLASGSNPQYIVKDLTRLSARWIGEALEVFIDESAT